MGKLATIDIANPLANPLAHSPGAPLADLDPLAEMVSQPAMSQRLISAGAVPRLAGRRLVRMNGVGNAIVVLDLRGSDLVVTAAEARAIAAVPALHFDQLMVVHDPREPGTAAFVAIHNTDGSSSGACGNGTRCVAWVLLHDTASDHLVLATTAGRLACRREGPWRFSVDMGRPTFDPAAIPVRGSTAPLDLPPDNPFREPFVVGMGNPHAVFFVPDAEAVDLPRVGPSIEHASPFPERANVSFAQVLDRRRIKLRVWERGAGATLGCGTGACATLVAAASTGRTDRHARVDLPGGSLEITWRDDDHVVMSGPVELEFEATLGAVEVPVS